MDFWLILAFFSGIVAVLLFNWLTNKRALSIVRSNNATKGNMVKADQTAELIEMLGEIKIAFDKAKTEGKDIKQFAVQDLPAIVVRHPMLVAKYGSRLYKLIGKGEGMTDFEGLL